jgi:hypothetical protein
VSTAIDIRLTQRREVRTFADLRARTPLSAMWVTKRLAWLVNLGQGAGPGINDSSHLRRGPEVAPGSTA